MPRRKKKIFNRLPNGVGGIKKLSGNRRNNYAVYEPDLHVNGADVKGGPIAYVDSWEAGFETLVVWHAMRQIDTGTSILPEIENQIRNMFRQMVYENPQGYGLDPRTYSMLIETALRNGVERKEYIVPSEFSWVKKEVKLPTFADIYESYYKEKYELSGKNYSDASKKSTSAAFKNCSVLHNKEFAKITYDDLQNNIDSHIGKLKHSSLELILSLYHGMYKYALKRDMVDKDYSSFVEIRIPDDDENGVPFTEDELRILWGSDLEAAKIAIVLCYSGWRISEFASVKIDWENNLFIGGMKTESGKNRIVPIHSSVLPILQSLPARPIKRAGAYRQSLYKALNALGIEKHTPHDCRHTFSWLCDEADVDKLSKQILMGHKPDDMVTDKVYGHRDANRLKVEIEKLPVFAS